VGQSSDKNEQPLYIEVWKEASESLRHHDNLYWHTVRHYTGLFVSASLLLLGGIFAFVAWHVVKRQGIYIGYAQNSQSITELNVVNSLNLEKKIEKEWLNNRHFDEEIRRGSPKQGSVRAVVPCSFFGIGVILIAVFVLEVGIALCSPEGLLSNSGQVHRSDTKAEIPRHDTKEVRANKAN